MDIFFVVGKVTATLLLPLAPVFIMVLLSAWFVTRKYATWPKDGEIPDQAAFFIGALILFGYLLFLIVFIPNIWWY